MKSNVATYRCPSRNGGVADPVTNHIWNARGRIARGAAGMASGAPRDRYSLKGTNNYGRSVNSNANHFQFSAEAKEDKILES